MKIKTYVAFFLLFATLVPALVLGQGSVIGKFSEKINGWLSGNPAEVVKVWVDFTDKGENTRLLSTPELFLSKRSIDRRAKRGGKIDFTDLPIWQPYLDGLQNEGFSVISKSKWFNSVTVQTGAEGLYKLAALPFVKKISFVAKGVIATTTGQKNDGIIKSEKRNFSSSPTDDHLLDYGESYGQLIVENIPAVHDLGYDGTGVFVGLMDAGFNNLAHEVFDSLKIVATWDFVNNDPDVGDHGMGVGTHGTMTLSSIAGYLPGTLIGTAYRSSYLLAKTENTESETPLEEDNWIAAAEWSDSIGVDVTSTSLSYLEFDEPYQSYTWQDMNGSTARITIAADLAVSKGITVFVSAGNNGNNPNHNTLGAPADGFSVITVGSVTKDSVRSPFSSVGLTADGRIKPDIMAMGSGTFVASPPARNSYTYVSGTSLSGPIAAGIAALMLQKNDTLSPGYIREVLRTTASQASNPDRLMGWGIANALSAINYAPVGIKEESGLNPNSPVILSNYPNPFNPSTTISFKLPEEKHLILTLYNPAGQVVQQVAEGTFPPGESKIAMDGTRLAAGVYLLVMNAGDKIYTLKICLLK